jgi:hypothetical protein
VERRFIFYNYLNISLKNVNNFKINLSGRAGSPPYGQDTIEPVF